MELPLRQVIVFPKLNELLAKAGIQKQELATALTDLNFHIYGRKSNYLEAGSRARRASLTKLSNYCSQLELLDDPCVFELGYYCTEQLKCYATDLRATMECKHTITLPLRCRYICQNILTVLEQMVVVVNVRYEGLS